MTYAAKPNRCKQVIGVMGFPKGHISYTLRHIGGLITLEVNRGKTARQIPRSRTNFRTATLFHLYRGNIEYDGIELCRIPEDSLSLRASRVTNVSSYGATLSLSSGCYEQILILLGWFADSDVGLQ